jgi:hypothetical protein
MMILKKLRAILRHKHYKLYSRPYELNIVGMRGDSTVPNRFDDEIHVFYKTGKHSWNYHVFKATTDPGTFWLENPMQPQGTAILAQGQYVDAYALGLHRGQYLALVERKPIAIIRNYDRKAHLDFLNGKKTTGMYGINIHRANAHGTTKYVDKYSAGCQVFENAEAFAAFIALCQQHSKLYGNRFTYTLIDFRAIRRETIRRVAIGTGMAGILALGIWALTGHQKIKSIAEQLGDAFKELFHPKEKASA